MPKLVRPTKTSGSKKSAAPSPFAVYRDAVAAQAGLRTKHAAVVGALDEAANDVASAAEALKVHVRAMNEATVSECGVTASVTFPKRQLVHLDVLIKQHPSILAVPGVVTAVSIPVLETLVQIEKMSRQDFDTIRYTEAMTPAVRLVLDG